MWEGLALNPAAPPDTLLRLLDPPYETAWSAPCRRHRRERPPEVVDALLDLA